MTSMQASKKVSQVFCLALIAMLVCSFCTLFVDSAFGGSFNFGNTTEEGSSNPCVAAHTYVCGRWAAPVSGNASYINVYGSISLAGTVVLKPVIYAENASNLPGTLLGEGDEVSVTSTGAVWTKLTGLDVEVVSGVYYWIGFYVVSSTGGSFLLRYKSEASYALYYSNGLTDPFTTTGSHVNYKCSIYATVVNDELPLASNIAASTNVLGSDCQFSVQWAAGGDTDLSHYIFSWTLEGNSWVNSSAVPFSSSWSNVTKNLGTNASLAGETIQWQIYANNTAANFASCGVQNLTLTLPTQGYVLAGPYYEDNGQVANRTVPVTVYYDNGETEQHLLNGTLGYATLIVLNPDLTPTYLSWPATDSLNYTRLYYLTDTTHASIKIFVPNEDSTPQIYQFTISDYAGMSNPYITSGITVDGTLDNQFYIVERKPITVSTVSFVMEQWHGYTIVFESDQGTYSQAFSAENSFYTNLNAGPLLFSRPSLPTDYAAKGLLYNATTIQVWYADYDNITSSLNYTISSGSGNSLTVEYSLFIDDFNSTYPSGLYSYYWTQRDSAVDYLVTVKAVRNGVDCYWSFAVSADSVPNPFDGLLDFLGDLPNGVDASQVVCGFIVVLGGLGVFSYYGSAAGCAFSWIMACILSVIGWYIIGVPMLVFSAFITVLTFIEEGKKSAREL